MNNVEQALISLIKKSQFGLSDNIDWCSIDMDALYLEASLQSVLGLVASFIPSEFLDSKWVEAQYRQKSSYIRYCNSQENLKIVLENSGIPFVILKGNASAYYYSDPSLRTMGDIDFIVPQECFNDAKEILLSAGYIEGEDNGRHCHFRKNNLEYELHHHFSHFDQVDIESYVIDGLISCDYVSIEGYFFPMLPKLANGLVLLDHLRRHLESSVGLRQIIDWMMYVYCNLDDSFWNSNFKSVAKEKGLEKLAITVTRMCQLYLGLPESIIWCKMANHKTCSRLMCLVFETGNFGSKNGNGSSIEKVSTCIKREGLFHWLQFAGEHNWKAYHKHHWLKPFCWFYQMFRYAKQGVRAGRNKKQLKGDLDRSKERYELLKELGID